MRRSSSGLSTLLFACVLLLPCASPGAQLVLVAGGGDRLDSAPAAETKLDGPFGVAFDPKDKLFIVEMMGNRLRSMRASGMVSLVAGNGEKGDVGDGGPAAKAQFNGPHSLATLPNGDVLVADTWNNRIRKIDAKTGAISTIIGTGE